MLKYGGLILNRFAVTSRAENALAWSYLDEFNQIPHRLVWVLPITTKHSWTSFTVDISSEKTGLKQTSRILCHQLRTVSVDRLIKRIGIINPEKMDEVKLRLRMIMGFD